MGYSERVWGGCGGRVWGGCGGRVWREGVGRVWGEVSTYPNQSVFLPAACTPGGTYNTQYTSYTASLHYYITTATPHSDSCHMSSSVTPE